jgi:hypothetical protein
MRIMTLDLTDDETQAPPSAARGQKAAGPADRRDGYAATGAGDCAEIAAKKEGHPSAISGLAT